MKIIGTLAAAGAIGGVGLAIAQSGMKENIEDNTDELEHQRTAVEAVPVMQRDLEHMRSDLGEVKDDIGKIEEAITKLAERN